ncbi:MAG: hypothetical protein H0X66_15145 [Verrucomicrobia bacterium]|jgi:sulfite exporter TauE/SafE|nr:hypothetical protein [Verrucomicrobiota bacterium]
MEKERSTYGLPRSIRYFSGAIFLVLAIYALLDAGLSSLARVLLIIGLITAGVYLVSKAVVDLFAFLFPIVARHLGRWLGRCVAIMRKASRD